jgi:hypothetical protein
MNKGAKAMFKRLTATLAAAAIALTGFSAAPAYADKNDAAKVLMGLAAIAILAQGLNQDKAVQPKPAPKPHVKTSPRRPDCRPGRHGARDCRHVERKKPRVCLRQKWTHDGWKRYYSKPCLRAHGFR